jgi:hypothetical protein
MPHYKSLAEYYDNVRKVEFRTVTRLNKPRKPPAPLAHSQRLLKDLPS